MCTSTLFTDDILVRLVGVLLGRLEALTDERSSLLRLCIAILCDPSRQIESEGDIAFVEIAAKAVATSLGESVDKNTLSFVSRLHRLSFHMLLTFKK